MPTAAAPRGSAIQLALGVESTFGTAPSGDWQLTPVYNDGLSDPQPNEADPILGTTRNNARDSTVPAPGLPNGVTGQLEVPLDLNHLWFWLKSALGAPQSSGSSDYTHVFTSGLEVLPHYSLERKNTSSLYLLRTGILAHMLSGEASRRPGYDRVKVDVTGRKESKLTSTGAGTPPAILARVPVLAAIPVLKLGGSAVADVISVSWAYNNGAKLQEYLGDSEGRPTGHDLDDPATFEVTVRSRYRNSTLYDAAKAMTPSSLELLWQNSSVRSLSLLAPVATPEPTGVPVTGPGRFEASIKYTCAQDASNPMLTATLKNGLAATAYA